MRAQIGAKLWRGHSAAKFVMPGLVPGIHVFSVIAKRKSWMAGTSPAMTEKYINQDYDAILGR